MKRVFPGSDVGIANTPASVPLIARLAHEIPKPKDWQALQRGCILLFQAELADPATHGYGRNGQTQGGIDIIGRRGGRHDQGVGIQCRLIAKRDREAKVMDDCREALALGLNIKEVIFATTAPDDVEASRIANRVELVLRGEGHDVKVLILGWDQLQLLIAKHEVAYNAFFPAAVASTTRREAGPPQTVAPELAAAIAQHLQLLGIRMPVSLDAKESRTDEDPKLHVRIDAYRDLFKVDRQTELAHRKLSELLEGEDLEDKPWARFRIIFNLGSVALDAGRFEQGAAHYEAAYALRPDDPQAVAGLALARAVQGRHDEAMSLARRALEADEPAEFAVVVLLQAAARSGWVGDPETLVPECFAHKPTSDLGLAEFLRWRSDDGWAERSLELAERHPDVPEFRQVRGLATLALLTSRGDVVPGGRSPVDADAVERAAGDLEYVAERSLAIGYADQRDLAAHVSNAGAILRLAGQNARAEALLRSGLDRLPHDPHVSRQLGLTLAARNARSEALAVLRHGDDPENRMLAAELVARDDPRQGLNAAMAIDPVALSPDAKRIRSRLLGELGIATGDRELIDRSTAELRAAGDALAADLVEIDWMAKSGAASTVETAQARLRAIAMSLPAATGSGPRYVLACHLSEQGLFDEAASVLEPSIDTSREGPGTLLYLQCLAAARRDERFAAATSRLPGSGASRDPAILWVIATHAWNVGDLDTAARATEEIIRAESQHVPAHRLRIEILIRTNRTAELLAELDLPIEGSRSPRASDDLRLATILAHFGYPERAAALAYRLFLQDRSSSRAWMTLAGCILGDGQRGRLAPADWHPAVVGRDSAVDVTFDDGSTTFFIIEPDETLRRHDGASLEPDHALAALTAGRTSGDRFQDRNGRLGTVTRIRHKYVARFQHILAHHEERFPEIFGFRKLDVDPTSREGLEPLRNQLRERIAWIDEEHSAYATGPWPLGMLAFRLGVDAIEAAASLAAAGRRIKVARGDDQDRTAALTDLSGNSGRGCVLDLVTFWTAWETRALEAIVATCGRVRLPRSVVDRLQARRELAAMAADGGYRSIGIRDADLVIEEATPELTAAWFAGIDGALAWIAAEATIEPVVAGDSLPDALREHLQVVPGDMFDALVVAHRIGLALISDDGPVRDLARGITVPTASTHQVLTIALDRGRIELDDWVKLSAALIERGHYFIGVTGVGLARAASLDAETGHAPGVLFSTVTRPLGGADAEPYSHVNASLVCLSLIWNLADARDWRARATALLLRSLLRDRVDRRAMFKALVDATSDLPALNAYLRSWGIGNFILYDG